jgi:Zn-dependent peptidase ImmA (M78 family)
MSSPIEKRAAEVLRAAGVRKAPVPVVAVAEHLGIRVESSVLGDDVSGLIVIKESGAIISYHEGHASVRQRFTIAHEIGHYVLHRASGPLFIDNNTYGIVMARDEASSTGEVRREREANAFAAALLMPTELIEKAVSDKHLDLADESALLELAREFDVSALAMTYRLVNLGYLKAPRPR